MVSILIRQSDIKAWDRCALEWRYRNIDGLAEEQGGSSVFGSVIHDCVLFLETSRDLDQTLDRFDRLWLNPELLDPTYRIDYYERGRSWKKFSLDGPRILRDWWGIIAWESDLVLAREFSFTVPIASGHQLHGTIDKLAVRYRADLDTWVVLVSDYKTGAKVPTYGYLEEDVQFSAYCYATTQPELWANIPRGAELMKQYASYPRYGEWVHLQAPKRMDAGIRTQRHYNRLFMAVDAIAESVAMRIFVPSITGDTCRFCTFRKQCGMPELED